MKILYLTNIRIPTEKAHGIQVMKMCEAFASANAEVELIIPTRKSAQMKDIDPFEYYGVEKKFSIKKLFSFDPAWLMKFPQGVYIRVQVLCFLASLFFFLLLKKNKSEFIFYTRDEYLLPLLQRFSKKVVWEAHTLPKNAKYYVRFWKKCLGVVAITEHLKKELEKLGVAEKKIIVAPDGVDLERFYAHFNKIESRKKLNLPLDKKIVLYSGHLYDWKGAQTLADASRSFSDGYEFIFVGGTEFDVEKFKKNNTQNKNIRIFGHQTHRDIPLFLSSADILILPNSAKSAISMLYTSPLKFFEYLASQKPIVVSNLPSLHEVGDKFDGIWYFRPDDAHDLARAIKVCLHEGQKTYSRDMTGSSWEKRAENILAYVQGVRK